MFFQYEVFAYRVYILILLPPLDRCESFPLFLLGEDIIECDFD